MTAKYASSHETQVSHLEVADVLETPTTGRSVEAEEDAPHKPNETLEIAMAK